MWNLSTLASLWSLTSLTSPCSQVSQGSKVQSHPCVKKSLLSLHFVSSRCKFWHAPVLPLPLQQELIHSLHPPTHCPARSASAPWRSAGLSTPPVPLSPSPPPPPPAWPPSSSPAPPHPSSPLPLLQASPVPAPRFPEARSARQEPRWENPALLPSLAGSSPWQEGKGAQHVLPNFWPIRDLPWGQTQGCLPSQGLSSCVQPRSSPPCDPYLKELWHYRNTMTWHQLIPSNWVTTSLATTYNNILSPVQSIYRNLYYKL